MENLDSTRKNLESMGYKVENISLSWIPKERITANKERNYKLFEALDDSDDVREFYYNLNEE